jgi:16S rRNA (cytosine1402-N4)-methyltransferase
MRMDKDSYISAYDLVNNLTKKELSSILRSFGQERYSNRIASFIVEERKKYPISTTAQLTKIILKAIPYSQIYEDTSSNKDISSIEDCCE